MNIELHIDELVLHGFASGDRHAIGQAVERELTRLLSERGLPPGLARGADIKALTGGAFTAAPGARLPVAGAQIAAAVYEGMGA